jgi:outer membrane protein OmpA-like peptidoglycan-associated protein
MRIRMTLLAALAVACLSAPAWAQSGEKGQVELGIYGLVTSYNNDNVGLESKIGAGGLLGYYFTSTFSLEAFADHTTTTAKATGQDVKVTNLGATFYGHTRGTVLGSLYLGAGYTRVFYAGAVDTVDNSAHLILGDRFSLGGRAAIRIEGRMDWLAKSVLSPTEGSAINFGAAAVISVFAFGGAPRDADGDGVGNASDQCPDTPRGARVDDVGCPQDFDGDGVYAGIDQCPDTPAGAFVNEVGCPTDTDNDTVFDGIDVCPNTPEGATVDDNGCPLDADQDGVFDGLDQCPDTPLGATVDADGCPLDGDLDGVYDGLDQCPDTPAGVTVDETGCPADLDGDGVLNAVDQCPDTPPGTEVDERGCPPALRDSDGDGVLDDQDRCPGTSVGVPVDAVGCAILFVVAEGVTRPLVLRGVHFEFNRSALTPDSRPILDEVAASLLAHTDVRIEIGGHSDSVGRRSYNMRLSLQRAQSVKAYLARQGVDPSRMETRGYGPDAPIADNGTGEGRAQNRRVELRLLSGGPSQ